MSDDVDRFQKQEDYMRQRRQKNLDEIESANDKSKKRKGKNKENKHGIQSAGNTVKR